MSELVVLVPVLNRPDRVEKVRDSLDATVKARLLFIATPGDTPEIEALKRAKADFFIWEGGYAAKINQGVKVTTEPLLFFAADDLKFHPRWFERAKAHLSDEVEVVGTNDLCSRRVRMGHHATHFLVTRSYAKRPLIDGNPGPLCETYQHSCVDDEFWATAAARGVLGVAKDSIVEHLHPDAGKAEWDQTYEKGRIGIRRDRRLLHRRRHLWKPLLR